MFRHPLLVPYGRRFSPPNPAYGSPSKPTTGLTFPLRPPKNCKLFASYSPPLEIPTRNHHIHSPLTVTGSTWTLATLIALSLAKHIAFKISPLSLKVGPAHSNPNTLAIEAGPLFFAAILSHSGALMSTATPITVFPVGLASWLETYSCVLVGRVLLSWFPNIPWGQQPMSGIRDLCDPYMSLFRCVILPPLFDSLDVGPILAFLLLCLWSLQDRLDVIEED